MKMYVCLLTRDIYFLLVFRSRVEPFADSGRRYVAVCCYQGAIFRLDTSVICHVLDNFWLINFARFVER